LARNGGQGWLTLGQASRTLGVTPNTLRRWADRGEISSFTTPGGHRRFLVSAVQALVPAARARRPALAPSTDRMARAYRRARPQAPSPWSAGLGDEQRVWFRQRGTELVGHLLAFLDADRGDLRVAETHAREYGAEAARLGASLTDTVEGFLRFRKPFIDELAQLARRRRLDTAEATQLLVDAEAALDLLLVALMTAHASS
jgi:excisionase family DNA binding protein